MRKLISIFLLFLSVFVFAVNLPAVEPNQKEMEAKGKWIAARFDGVLQGAPAAETPIFSFIYDGKPSAELLKDWKREVIQKTVDETKVVSTITWTEPGGGLCVKCVLTDYTDFPTIDWTVTFENLSNRETPIIESVKAIDVSFQREEPFSPKPFSGWDPDCGDALVYNAKNEYVLHRAVGSPCRADDYKPIAEGMEPGKSIHQSAAGGRASNTELPYFNLQAGNQGWIAVIGWPGQWSADFVREGDAVHLTAGQEDSHFQLMPGETFRTPLIAFQPWYRDTWYDAQNIWRKWMVKYNVPRQPDGTLITHHIAACSSHYFAEMTQADTKSQINFVDQYLKHGIKLDYWWMDAGWYPCDGNWGKVGTWEIDQARFPGGFRSITDHNRSVDVQNIVWFEPERVEAGTWLTENHPEWLIGGEGSRLFNLGDPDARNWLTDHVDAFLKREGVEFYRQDHNFDPLSYWRSHDAENRKGMTENKYVCGYLAYWDALLERNPGLRIDSCASGGRRNDLETMRRAVPLLRSDYLLEPVSQQCHSYGIQLWIPFHGTGFKAFDDYKIRSIFVPYLNLCYDARDDAADWKNVCRNLEIWQNVIVPCFGADYYPLTEYSLDSDDWCGWQMNDPENGIGTIQLFRRADSPMETGVFKLRGLDSDAKYIFKNVDSGETWSLSGKEAAETGVRLTITEQPGASIWSYKKGSNILAE